MKKNSVSEFELERQDAKLVLLNNQRKLNEAELKKSKVIKDAIIAINRLEKRGDSLYTHSVKKLFVEQKDALTTMATTNIYDRFERATDSFEAAANVIERIVLKNS